jgi:hypothetical protein
MSLQQQRQQQQQQQQPEQLKKHANKASCLMIFSRHFP